MPTRCADETCPGGSDSHCTTSLQIVLRSQIANSANVSSRSSVTMRSDDARMLLCLSSVQGKSAHCLSIISFWSQDTVKLPFAKTFASSMIYGTHSIQRSADVRPVLVT